MFSSRDPIKSMKPESSGHAAIRLPGRVATTLSVLLAIALSPAPTRAAEPATRPAAESSGQPSMAKWFSDLASTDPRTREKARDALMCLNRNDLPRLQELLRRTPRLAPSQVIALREIVQEIYLAGEPYAKDTTGGVEHGFLGITMDQVDSPQQDQQQPNDNGQSPGIIVAGRFSGFGAGRTLHDGDVILGSLDPDKVFNNANALKQAISGADPGVVIRLKVLRHGQIVVVPVVLGSMPKDLTPESADSFRRERAERFDEYWRESFAPLLKESVG